MTDSEPSKRSKFRFPMNETSEYPAQKPMAEQQPSSPLQPFPEFEPDLAFELAQLSSTFAHEVDLQSCFNNRSLPKLAHGVEEGYIASGIFELQVTWVDAGEECEGDKGMREATERALESARKMFGESPKGETGRETMVEQQSDEEARSLGGDDKK